MRAIFSLVALIVSFFTVGGCKDEKIIVEPPIDKNEYYEITTIDGKNIEEYRKLPIGSLDIPNKIIFTRRDSVFEGKVFFDKIGERIIDRTCPRSCFAIALNGEFGNLTTIYFTDLQFVNTILDGKFEFYSPTSDRGYQTFNAQKKR